MSQPKSIVFVDGENLLLRFKSMADRGNVPKQGVIYEDNELLWSGQIPKLGGCFVKRVGYYTTKAGDQLSIDELSLKISKIKYDYMNGFGFLNPHVFKKAKKGNKTKSVDINIVTDMLRHTYNKTIDEILLVSGDGDYVPTIEECMRQGVRVSVAALSSGLSSKLQLVVDEYYDLDNIFFVNQPII